MNKDQLFKNKYFQNKTSNETGENFIPGIIISRNNNIYRIMTETGQYQARLPGHFTNTINNRNEFPVPGDRVLLTNKDSTFFIEKIMNRTSYFSRLAAGTKLEEQVIVANIDTMFIVASIEGGRNFTERGIERYLIMVNDGGSRPVILLNKTDLCSEEIKNNYLRKTMFIAGDTPVITVSTVTGEGMDELQSEIKPGETAAFTGPSGVGKSSIINYLSGKNQQETGEIRNHDKKGRHTTTASELIMLNDNKIVIDTPGLRELKPFCTEKAINETFEDIYEASMDCKFRNCRHINEPGCNVLQRVSEGYIDFERYQNYINIRDETKKIEKLKTIDGRLQKKKEDKELAKYVKQIKKIKN